MQYTDSRQHRKDGETTLPEGRRICHDIAWIFSLLLQVRPPGRTHLKLPPPSPAPPRPTLFLPCPPTRVPGSSDAPPGPPALAPSAAAAGLGQRGACAAWIRAGTGCGCVLMMSGAQAVGWRVRGWGGGDGRHRGRGGGGDARGVGCKGGQTLVRAAHS